jgi:galactose mutarotase-like enzyme
VKLLGGPWTLEVRPERGGRITSLRLDGEELLEQGTGVDDAAADGFVEGGASGWDEMVPNVDATTHRSVSMRCSGRVVPWQLERRIELGEGGVRISYVYTNCGAGPQYAYWCAHPLFRFESGMEIGVPGGEQLAQLAPGTSTKVFLPKGTIDRVRLRWISGAAIEMAWDAALTPYVGVWVCNGDLGGYRQVAIEPATGGNDRPDPAAPPPLLEPREQFRWWLEVRDGR